MRDEIAIELVGISKNYKLKKSILNPENKEITEVLALKDISFEIKKGESVGIFGANGSGKSTLLKILAGVISPSKGQVKIKGRVASILDIGAGFHPELSGRENIFLNGQILGFKKVEITKKYDEIIEFSGVKDFIEEPVKNYSNGMYLRLAFSIMAHLDFDVYLFDEIFSVGDAEFYHKTRAKFQELIKSKKTLIFVSHSINDLESHDKYFLMEKGTLVKSSSSMNLLDNYMEKSFHLTKNQAETFQYNSIKTDFSEFIDSEEIKMERFEFYQLGNDKFKTNEKFFMKIEFKKLKDENTIDLMIRVSESQNNALFTTSPLIKNGFNSFTKSGTYTFNCEIPPCIFNEKLYFVDILFFKNGLNILDSYLIPISNKINIPERPYVLKGVLVFKPLFKNEFYESFDLGLLNTSVGLTPAFDWSIEHKN